MAPLRSTRVATHMQPRLHLVARWAASIGLVLLVTAAYYAFLPVNPTTVALTYVVLILFVASAWGVVESTAASLTATICLNVFFLPPVGTLTIADPQNWIALTAFLLAGIVASQLSGRARRRTVEALARQRDLERLTHAGILTRAEEGHQTYYRANRQCPVFEDLHGLIRKTFGAAWVIQSSLHSIAGRIRLAFVYGSMASGKATSASDVDVLVVGAGQAGLSVIARKCGSQSSAKYRL